MKYSVIPQVLLVIFEERFKLSSLEFAQNQINTESLVLQLEIGSVEVKKPADFRGRTQYLEN